MINYYDLPDEKLPMSMRVLRKILQERGWQAEKLAVEGWNRLFLTRPDGKVLRVASSTPPTTNVFALGVADDKLDTNVILTGMSDPEIAKKLGLAEPVRIAQPATAYAGSVADVRNLLGSCKKVVIKPADGAHGRGVTVGITAETADADIAKAVELAEQNSPTQRAMVQEQIEAQRPELRVICIDYKFVVAIARIPAAVTGDGEHTVGELIKIENDTIRTEPYKSKLAKINAEKAAEYLGDKLNYIPAPGEKVRVSATCNIGQGGTAEDMSRQFSEEQRHQAENIARAAQLPVVGIDYFGDYVLEINATPSLYYPIDDQEKAETIVAKYVDYLEKL